MREEPRTKGINIKILHLDYSEGITLPDPTFFSTVFLFCSIATLSVTNFTAAKFRALYCNSDAFNQMERREFSKVSTARTGVDPARGARRMCQLTTSLPSRCAGSIIEVQTSGFRTFNIII
ncbi:hypothetical protein EVAR_7856_1 [Eumeta japonica]|uniref:Uncharacterized protein n=1 Tax=Eumeta variegata TaxID=151549 RepID=A0A4C1TV00_EUMVA|nr:hypothetical protein EVAR_7856_1 [Eumeta japonica]